MFKHNPTIKYSKMYNENTDECDSTLFLQSNPTETRTNHCLSNTGAGFEAELLLLDILRYLPLYVAFPTFVNNTIIKNASSQVKMHVALRGRVKMHPLQPSMTVYKVH